MHLTLCKCIRQQPTLGLHMWIQNFTKCLHPAQAQQQSTTKATFGFLAVSQSKLARTTTFSSSTLEQIAGGQQPLCRLDSMAWAQLSILRSTLCTRQVEERRTKHDPIDMFSSIKDREWGAPGPLVTGSAELHHYPLGLVARQVLIYTDTC